MLTLQDLQTRMGRLNDWSLEDKSITKELHFKDFKEAMEFINKVAEIAEKYNHHPDIYIYYNVVRLVLTDHHENALTERDFDVAEEIDKISFAKEEKEDKG